MKSKRIDVMYYEFLIVQNIGLLITFFVMVFVVISIIKNNSAMHELLTRLQ